MDNIRIQPALNAGSVNMGSKHAHFNDTIYTQYPDWNQSTFSYQGINLIDARIETSPHGWMEKLQTPTRVSIRIKLVYFSPTYSFLGFPHLEPRWWKCLNHEYFNYCPPIAFPETNAACHHIPLPSSCLTYFLFFLF